MQPHLSTEILRVRGRKLPLDQVHQNCLWASQKIHFCWTLPAPLSVCISTLMRPYSRALRLIQTSGCELHKTSGSTSMEAADGAESDTEWCLGCTGFSMCTFNPGLGTVADAQGRGDVFPSWIRWYLKYTHKLETRAILDLGENSSTHIWYNFTPIFTRKTSIARPKLKVMNEAGTLPAPSSISICLICKLLS